MEVLFISHKYPPSVGGMQKQSYELIHGFEQSHKVHKIVHDNKESKLSFLLGLKKRVRGLINQNPGIQIVHCNDGVCAFFCKWIHKEYGIPVILTFHGLDLLWPNGFYQRALPRLINNFDGIICVSDFTAEECLKRGFAEDKVNVVYNGVDLNSEYETINVDNALLEKFSNLKNKGKRILISIGRPVKRKGFSWFIKNVLPSLGDDYHYIIIGPGTKFSAFQRLLFKIMPSSMLKQLNLLFGWSTDQDQLKALGADPLFSGSFSWFHKLSYDSILFGLLQSDLFIMPNIQVAGDAEGFGLVALESNVQGSFVMAANLDGIPSAVTDNRNGWLIESENAKAWQNKIQSFFAMEPEQQDAKARAAQKYVHKNYSWTKMVEAYEDVFRNYLRD